MSGTFLLLDRLRLSEGLADEAIAVRRETVFRLLDSIEIIQLTRPILTRAAQPFPKTLESLGTIYLASALLCQEEMGSRLVMAIHDVPLATASGASGFRVVGRGELGQKQEDVDIFLNLFQRRI